MIKASRKVPLSEACVYCHVGRVELVRSTKDMVPQASMYQALLTRRSLGVKGLIALCYVECGGCRRRSKRSYSACQAIREWYASRGSGLQRQNGDGSFVIPFNPGAMALAPPRESWVRSVSPGVVT